MRRINKIFQAGIVTALLVSGLVVGVPVARAGSANDPSLVISQLKITSSNGQLITLYNATNTALDMSKYQLEYFNSYDLTKATSSRLIALSGTVPPHGYFMVNDGALLLCYQVTVDSVSLGLSSAAGLVEVLGFNQVAAGGSVTPSLQDYAGWSKTAVASAQTLPANTNALLERQPTDDQNNPVISSPGAGSWLAVQPDAGNACNLVNSTTNTTVQTGFTQLLPPAEPPATIINAGAGTSSTSGTATLPTADIGLTAPSVTEILPNPAGTGNDGTDEFIELYNSNIVPFDLGGFGLQVGTTSLHNFTFPTGASLAAKSFEAFYSADTGLSLSNTSGQVKLLDPFGNAIAITAAYGTAKDGQAWALANGQWYWTTHLTPGAANIIDLPLANKSSSKSSTKSSTTKSTTRKVKAAKASKTSKLTGSNLASDTVPMTPIHPWSLAAIGAAALLYGAYEYRTDLANRVRKLRRHFGHRQPNRP